MNWWWPLHSWHPVVVHLPLVGLLFAVLFDLVAVQNRSGRWRDAATALWWIGFLGAAAAITTGLIAYNRVEHSDAGHEEMVLHRNLVLLSVAVLLIAVIWRWRRPYSRGAALLGLVGALGLAGGGYLGGDLVYRHGLGIPTEVLEQVARERGPDSHEHPEDRARPDTTPDTTQTHTPRYHTATQALRRASPECRHQIGRSNQKKEQNHDTSDFYRHLPRDAAVYRRVYPLSQRVSLNSRSLP